MKQAFQNFSSQDYIQGACLTIENANRHFSLSEAAYQANFIGLSISHLVLSAEEFIKSFILLCLSGDDHFINDGEKIELFKNHKFKHKHIALFLSSISDSAVKKFEDEIFDYILTLNHSEGYSREGYYINQVFDLIKLSDDKLRQLLVWLKKANDLKNNGFYVGVIGNWESPENFNNDDYAEALTCVMILKNSIKPLFEMPLTNEDLLAFLNQ